MNKKLINHLTLIVFLSVIFFSTATAHSSESPIKFAGKTFGGKNSDEGNCVQQTADGGYILLGATNSFGAGLSDIYLVKTDALGNELWHKTFGGKGIDEGNCVQQTADGGYILIGTTNSLDAKLGDMYLIKTDEKGNKIFEKTFGDANKDEHGYSVQQTADGGYILFGDYLVKTDEKGNELWRRTYEDTNIALGYSAQQTADGGYILLGSMKSGDFGRRRLNLVKVGADGKAKDGWTSWLIMISDELGSAVRQTKDGGYIILGGTATLSPGKRDIYLTKVDAGGKSQWVAKLGGDKYDSGSAVRQTKDGGYILTGLTQSKGAGKADIYLGKTDENGNLLWEKTFGGIDYDRGNSVQQTSDGGYVILGSAQKEGDGESDMYLIKTDENGNVN